MPPNITIIALPPKSPELKAFKRVRNCIASLIEQAGGGAGLSPMQCERIERAAQLQVLAGEARTRCLCDPTPDNINAAVRIENAAERALKTVATLSKKQAPDLRTYLASRRTPHDGGADLSLVEDLTSKEPS